MDRMSLKPNLDEVVERYMALWEGRLQDQIIVIIEPNLSNKGGHEIWEDKSEFEYLRMCPDVPSMFKANEGLLKFRAQIDDDYIPVAWLTYGSAAGGAFLGADMEFYPASGGYSPPLIKSWDQIEDLDFDPEWKWNREIRKAARYFAEHADGRFGTAMMEVLHDLNLVHNLRGFQFLYDISDHKDEVERLMEMGVDFTIQWIEMVRESLGDSNTYRGGRFSFYGLWLPKDTIFLSVDAYTLCDPKVLEWGKPYIQKLTDHFGSGWLHNHAKGLHLLPILINLENIVMMEFCDDPGEPILFPRMHEITDLTGDLPITIGVDFEYFVHALREHRLKGGVVYWVKGTPSITVANELMKEVRKYRI